jgi:hypothetical protein
MNLQNENILSIATPAISLIFNVLIGFYVFGTCLAISLAQVKPTNFLLFHT